MVNLFSQVPGFIRRSPVECLGIAVLLVILSYVIVPLTAGAKSAGQAEDRAAALTVAAMQNETVPFGQLPDARLRGPYYVKTVVASAYNSVPEQTDDTPFITASGTHVRHGVIAANFLPIGTHVTIPDIYGDEIFVVEDRMNERYQNNIDIWMESIADAKQFGRRSVKIYVYTETL
jgi:3D (Asp-Asp-Asp) domain-containing protein